MASFDRSASGNDDGGSDGDVGGSSDALGAGGGTMGAGIGDAIAGSVGIQVAAQCLPEDHLVSTCLRGRMRLR